MLKGTRWEQQCGPWGPRPEIPDSRLHWRCVGAGVSPAGLQRLLPRVTRPPEDSWDEGKCRCEQDLQPMSLGSPSRERVQRPCPDPFHGSQIPPAHPSHWHPANQLLTQFPSRPGSVCQPLLLNSDQQLSPKMRTARTCTMISVSGSGLDGQNRLCRRGQGWRVKASISPLPWGLVLAPWQGRSSGCLTQVGAGALASRSRRG